MSLLCDTCANDLLIYTCTHGSCLHMCIVLSLPMAIWLPLSPLWCLRIGLLVFVLLSLSICMQVYIMHQAKELGPAERERLVSGLTSVLHVCS